MPESCWILTNSEKKDGVMMSNKAEGRGKVRDIKYWNHEDKKHRLKVVTKSNKRFLIAMRERLWASNRLQTSDEQGRDKVCEES